MSSNELGPIISQLNMQTRLFNNVLEGIKPADETKRLSDELNNVDWLAGHLVFARYTMAKGLGAAKENPYDELYANFKPFDSNLKYPSINESKAKFAEVTELITPALANISNEHLHSALPFELPIGDNTVRGLVAFITHHEAYHIGQIGLLRKYLGSGPMKY